MERSETLVFNQHWNFLNCYLVLLIFCFLTDGMMKAASKSDGDRTVELFILDIFTYILYSNFIHHLRNKNQIVLKLMKIKIEQKVVFNSAKVVFNSTTVVSM